MKQKKFHIGFAVIVSILSANVVADTLLVKANGYTLNAQRKLVAFQAMAIDDQGRVLEIGSNQKLLAKYSKAQKIDVRGKTVLPGLIDAHGHIFSLGKAGSQLDLRGTNSLQDAQAAIAAYSAKFPAHQ